MVSISEHETPHFTDSQPTTVYNSLHSELNELYILSEALTVT